MYIPSRTLPPRSRPPLIFFPLHTFQAPAIATHVFCDAFKAAAIAIYVFCDTFEAPAVATARILRNIQSSSDSNLCICDTLKAPVIAIHIFRETFEAPLSLKVEGVTPAQYRLYDLVCGAGQPVFCM